MGEIGELAEDTLRSRAKTLLGKKGWQPGDKFNVHSMIQLLVEFGKSTMREPPTDRCGYPDCGCDADAVCRDALDSETARARIADLEADNARLRGARTDDDKAFLNRIAQALSYDLHRDLSPDAIDHLYQIAIAAPSTPDPIAAVERLSGPSYNIGWTQDRTEKPKLVSLVREADLQKLEKELRSLPATAERERVVDDPGDITVHMASYDLGLRDGYRHPQKAARYLAACGPLMDEPGFVEAQKATRQRLNEAARALATSTGGEG